MDTSTDRLRFDEGSFDPLRGDLDIGGRHERLRPRTAAVLACLLEHRGRVVPKEELMRAVWPDVVVTDDSLAQCLKEIRRALGPAADRVRTLPRVGYAFVAAQPRPAEPVPAAASAHSAWPLHRRLVLGCAAIASTTLLAGGWWSQRPARVPDIPMSVLVLPLQAAPGSDTPGYLAGAMTEQLTTDLSRISDSFVIAYGTARTFEGKTVDARKAGLELNVRYVVEGTLRPAADRLDLDLRLVDTATGRIAWSDRLTDSRANIERMHAEVTAQIARALHLKLVDAEAARPPRVASHPDAHDLTMQAWSLWQRQDTEANLRARALLQRALELDPDSALAWSLLSYTYVSEIFIDRTASRNERLRSAAEAAERAYQLDPAHTNALGALGTVRALQGRLEESAGMFKQALRTNPNYAPAEMWLGVVATEMGEFEEAIVHSERAIRLSPRDPRLSYFHTVQAVACLHAGRARDALAAAERAQEAPGPHRYATVLVAAAVMRTAQTERARRVLAEFMQANPGYTLATLRADQARWRPRYRERQEVLLHELHEAGLPEG